MNNVCGLGHEQLVRNLSRRLSAYDSVDLGQAPGVGNGPRLQSVRRVQTSTGRLH